MSLKGKRVLLTGGTGFIGSHLAATLVAAKADVRLLVRSSSKGDALGPLWDKLPRVIADIEDPASFTAAVKSCDPEFVFHLAKPRTTTFARQSESTSMIASVLSKHAPHLQRLIRTAHAAPSQSDDQALAESLSVRFKVPVTTLELYLVYGPGQRPGDFPRNLAEALVAGKPAPAPPSGKDLVFVGDVAEAYVAAAESPKALGAWIPVGSGTLTGGPSAAAGHAADLSLARKLLGWSPKTSLDDGMAQLIEWLRETRGVRGG
jgi:nucleoside-diphosphate-sugar epimerase